MPDVRPGHRCHPNPFPTRHAAARRAWLLADQGKPVDLVECPDGYGWHLAPTTTTTGA